MALTVLSQPLYLFEPARNVDGSNLSIVLDSDISSYYAFRYAWKLFVNTQETFLSRVAPLVEDGFGKGIVQFYKPLRNSVSFDKHTSTGEFQDCVNSYAQYDVVLGEESDGTIGGTGASYSISYGATVSGFVWNGTQQYGETASYLKYMPGLVDSTTVKFLTNAPREQDIRIEESSMLYWLQGVTASQVPGPSAGSLQPFYMRVRRFNGNVQENFFIFPGIDLDRNTMVSLAMGPPDLNALADAGRIWDQNNVQISGPLITCATNRYDVKLGHYNTSTTQYDLTETRTYYVTCGCERFTPYRFCWLNPRGGFDTYTFRLKSTRTITNDKQEFSTFLSRLNGSNRFTYTPGDRGRTNYQVNAMESAEVLSVYLTAEESAWLCELYESKEVYLITTDLDGNITYDPIIITDSKVEDRDKKGYGNRLLSHRINFDRAYNRVVS